MLTAKTRILIVDDHAVVRKGLQSFLELHPAFEVAGEAASGEESVTRARELRPDLILMDVRMPGMNGIEACRRILEEQSDTKVVMLTSYSDEESVMASILAGAKGYILKKVDTDILMKDLERVSQGESLLDPAVTQQVFERIRVLTRSASVEDAMKTLDGLTNQEKRILTLIAKGKTNKEIASELLISSKTVRNHVTNILGKLNLSNRTQAATYAAGIGLNR
ncbi:MAG: response regulator [Bacillota bacterium]